MDQYPRIIEATGLPGMMLRLRFADGSGGDVDLMDRLHPLTGMLKDLSDPVVFSQVRVNAEAGTVVWPNGVDLDPDVLYALAHGLPIPGVPASR